jgi:hypothetical protein
VEDMEKLFNVTSSNYIRLYKKSLFWTMVFESDVPAKIITALKEANIKYDILSKAELLKNINKHILQHNYTKDSNNLKAGRSDKKSIDNSSWRKGSNCSSNPSSDKKDNSFKRDRFNSEGNNHNAYTNNRFDDGVQEIEIDMNNIKYSLNSKLY